MKSKTPKKAWDELIRTIEKDPWGLPYRIAFKKLKRATPSLTETLDVNILDKVINKLFPEDPFWDSNVEDDLEYITWKDEYEVSIPELCNTFKKGANANKAPGIDGIKTIFLKKIPEILVKKLVTIYNIYIKSGVFPKLWKRAILVLIPKGEFNPEEPKVRPICLLNELGKVMERILEGRIQDWMQHNPASRLAPNQFGFRSNTSTCDALLIVKSL